MRCPIIFGLNWLAILGHYFGLYNAWFMGLFCVVAHVRWWLAMHDILHLQHKVQ